MTKEQILQKMCIKMKFPFSSVIIKKDKTWLRGFLLNLEVMKAVWGEEEIEKEFDNFELVKENVKNIGWQYHAQQLVLLSTDEIIEYYGRYV
jgi:hypothetical protein